MARKGSGNVSGYQSHGPEKRADAGRPHAAKLGGSPMIRVPFHDVKPLGTPAKFDLEKDALRMRKFAVSARRISRVLGAQWRDAMS